MTNTEKAKLYQLAYSCSTCAARHNHIDFDCDKAICRIERKQNLDWLLQDYREPVPCTLIGMTQINGHQWAQDINWDQVPVDTLVEVWIDPNKRFKRYFAKYENNIIYCWSYGRTSKTVNHEDDIHEWNYIKLAKE